MTATVAVVVNPTAGRGRAAAAAQAAEQRLRARGLQVERLVGADGAEAAALATAAVADGVAALVGIGGDGLVNLALNAVAGTDVPLGIVPAGTGNDLAHTLGLPKGDPAAAAEAIAAALEAGHTRPVDAVRAAGRWFGCVLGAGFDSRVNDRANRLRWPRGPMRYNVAILAELRVFSPLPFVLELDGERWETEAMLVAVGNARSYGAGMQVCPQAEVDDGLLDVTVLLPVSKPEFAKTFPRVYKGTHLSHPAVVCRRARVVTLSSPGVTAYADGEFLADLPVTCEVVPAAVHVLC